MRKKLLSLFLILLLLTPLPVCAAASITLSADQGVVAYSFYYPDDTFLLLTYNAPNESGSQVIYSENGFFEGEISLRHVLGGGKMTVAAQFLDSDRKVASGTMKLSAEPGYTAPKGKASAKVTNFKLTETVDGFSYSFSAAGTDYMMLRVRNKQESAFFPVYSDASGCYAGEVALPLTYARTLSTVQVLNGKGVVMAEDQVRKGYKAPEAVQRQDGRLSGVTVCIDPGHQEGGHLVSEPLGPGLEGATTGTSGMAQGLATMRKESIVVLEISMVLRDELLRQGANVVMTRERQDIFLTNQERCQIAADADAHIMLRLHTDTRENRSKLGFSIYAPLNSAYARAVAEPSEYRYMGELLMDAMKTRVGYELDDKYGFVQLSDQFVGNNWAKMVCFLIEMGYMSTPREDYLLSTPVYQQWLAEGMAQGVYEIALHRGWIKK